VLGWAKRPATPADDYGHSIAAAPDGTAYVVGYTAGAIEPGVTNTGGDDLFVARYDTSGVRAWIRQRGTSAEDRAQDATVDAMGRPLVVGYTDGSLDGNTSAGGRDIFLARFSTSGAWELTKQRGSSGSENTWGVAVDGLGRAVVACVTSGAFDGQSNRGGNDLCAVAWNPDGTHAYTRIAGSPGGDSPSSCAADLARTGFVYVSLITDGSLDGSPNRGMNDTAVAKLDVMGNLL
jgi:hypothetical protein